MLFMPFSIFSKLCWCGTQTKTRQEEKEETNSNTFIANRMQYRMHEVKNVVIDKSVFDMIYNLNVLFNSLPFIVFSKEKTTCLVYAIYC